MKAILWLVALGFGLSLRDGHPLMVIRFLTLSTPFISLANLVARSFSAILLALPYYVTLPLFVSTLVLTALVER